jgi:hypothetical protein
MGMNFCCLDWMELMSMQTQAVFTIQPKGDLSSHIAIAAIINSGDESAIESAAVVWRKSRHRRGFQRV